VTENIIDFIIIVIIIIIIIIAPTGMFHIHFQLSLCPF